MGEVTESDFIESLFEQVVCRGLSWTLLCILSKVCFLLVTKSDSIAFDSFFASFILHLIIGWSWGLRFNLCFFFHGGVEDGLLRCTLSTHIQIYFTLRCHTFLFHSLSQLFILFLVNILKAFILVTVTGRCFWKKLCSRWWCVFIERIVCGLFTTRSILSLQGFFLQLSQLELKNLYFTS